MVFGKRWLFLIGNGADTRIIEMGRKSPDADNLSPIYADNLCHRKRLQSLLWSCHVRKPVQFRDEIIVIYLVLPAWTDGLVLC